MQINCNLQVKEIMWNYRCHYVNNKLLRTSNDYELW